MASYTVSCDSAVSSRSLSTGRTLPVGLKVPFVDSGLAATTAKLDAATARIALMEEELASLRAKNERLEALHSADLDGNDDGGA